MFRRFPLALVAALALVANLGAQGANPTPSAQTPPPPPAAPPARAVPMQNVKIDVVITDTFGPTPVKKTVTMLLLDGRRGSIRSSQRLPVNLNGKTDFMQIGIDIDAIPEIRSDGRVALQLTVSYTPTRADVTPGGNAAQQPADINESMTTLLIDGKGTLLSQSADPQSDRKVTLEVTATVVR